jgi:hypothetical protein
VFSHAEYESSKAADDENAERPLNFGAVIAKPQNDKSNNDSGCSCSERKPGQTILV